MQFSNEELVIVQEAFMALQDKINEDRNCVSIPANIKFIDDHTSIVNDLNDRVQSALNEQAGGTHETLKDQLPPFEGL